MKNSKHTEKVEQYILNQLSESEKATFQTALLFDRNLQNEVKVMRQLQKVAITDKPLVTPSTFGKTLPWGLTVALLAGLAFFLISRMDKTESVETEVPIMEDKTDTEKVATIPDADRAVEIQLPPKKEDIQVIEKDGSKKSDRSNKKQAIESSKPQMIAANYEANSLIESEFGTSLRGNYTFNITTPKANQRFSLQDGKLNWILEGSLETNKRPDRDFSLLLEIYTNSTEQYQRSKPLAQSPISLEEVEESVYRFTYQQALNVDLRLYYYLLRDDFTGAVLAGGRFKVTP